MLQIYLFTWRKPLSIKGVRIDGVSSLDRLFRATNGIRLMKKTRLLYQTIILKQKTAEYFFTCVSYRY
jgi:hypothetical protein